MVSTVADRRAVAKVVARATRRQLYTEPWRSTLAVALVTAGGVLLGALWLLACPVIGYAVDAAVAVAFVLLCGAFGMGLATRISIFRELRRQSRPGWRSQERGRGRSRAWILQTSTSINPCAGAAAVIVRDVDTNLWRPISLAAHPRGVGLGRRIGRHLEHEADRAGATIRIWCTRWLAPTYQRYGFVTDRRLLIWHRMHRAPSQPAPPAGGEPGADPERIPELPDHSTGNQWRQP